MELIRSGRVRPPCCVLAATAPGSRTSRRRDPCRSGPSVSEMLSTRPTTNRPEGVLRFSYSLNRQASVKNFIVVSKLIFIEGDTLYCMPILLIGLMNPCSEM